MATENTDATSPYVMRVRNLTPHAVTLVGEDGRSVELPSDGEAPRVATNVEPLGHLLCQGIRIARVREVMGREVEALPEQQPGTYLIVSRLVVDALPDRPDLVCPTNHRRDEDGRIDAAAALATSRSAARPAPDHLVVLAGGNPMPNFQAIATLRPERVTILATPETNVVARRTRAAAKALAYKPDVEIRTCREANDRTAVIDALEEIEPGWALSYTGGTKVMAAHARAVYERLGDGRLEFASVIDGAVRRDDGSTHALEDSDASLRSLALLHGHRLVNGSKPKVTLEQIHQIAPLLRQRVRSKRIWRADDPQLGSTPSLVRRLLTEDTGFWLETIASAAAARVGNEVILNAALRLGGQVSGAPELDVLVRVGWTPILLSCTVDPYRQTQKLKLMEAQRRVTQLGGARAVAVLVCLADDQRCVDLVKEVTQVEQVDSPVHVLGRPEVLRWLNGDVSGLRALTRR